METLPKIVFRLLVFKKNDFSVATDPFGEDEDIDIDIPAVFQSHIDDALRIRQTYRQTLDSLFKDVELGKERFSFLLFWNSLRNKNGTALILFRLILILRRGRHRRSWRPLFLSPSRLQGAPAI